MYKLVTIVFSHYNEKARWGLDRFNQPFEESGYMPFLHMPPVAWATRGASDAGQDNVSTRFSTPVLICEDGQRICDSSRILRYLDERHRGDAPSLYAPAEVEEVERDLHDTLGAHSRRLAYYYLLDDKALMHEVAEKNVGRLQSGIFKMVFPLGRASLKKSLRIDAKRAQRSKDKVLESFERMSQKLEDGRPYLCGDRFSAADLSFACMAVPSLLVSQEEGFGAYLPAMDRVGGEARDFAAQLRATPAGAHAMRMFADER
jgi:glutathione S-transferase